MGAFGCFPLDGKRTVTWEQLEKNFLRGNGGKSVDQGGSDCSDKMVPTGSSQQNESALNVAQTVTAPLEPERKGSSSSVKAGGSTTEQQAEQKSNLFRRLRDLNLGKEKIATAAFQRPLSSGAGDRLSGVRGARRQTPRGQ